MTRWWTLLSVVVAVGLFGAVTGAEAQGRTSLENAWAGSWSLSIYQCVLLSDGTSACCADTACQGGRPGSATFQQSGTKVTGTLREVLAGSELAFTGSASATHLSGSWVSGSEQGSLTLDLGNGAGGPNSSFSGMFSWNNSGITRTAKLIGTRTSSVATPSKKMSWTMPNRFGIDGKNGIMDYSLAQPNERTWPVEFTLPGCSQDGLASYVWLVDGGSPATTKVVAGKTCRVAVDVGKLGKHHLTAEPAGGGQGYVADIDARDFVIVGIGDSVASGEGNPDISSGQKGGPLWQDLRCDRSAVSFEAQAALAVERHHPQSSVSFLHLACSGATIWEGLIGGYEGINQGGAEANLEPQVVAAKKQTAGRPIDAVIISIGANDVGFSPVLSFCFKWEHCPFRNFEKGKELNDVIAARIAALGGLYDKLAARLKPLVPANRVYINLYPDELHDASGKLCTELLSSPARAIAADEVEWLYRSFMTPLNEAIRDAAGRAHWNVIEGGPEAFSAHGYCAGPTIRWVRTYTESGITQGNHNGTMHPNNKGHDAMGDLVATLLIRDLFPSGKPRAVGT